MTLVKVVAHVQDAKTHVHQARGVVVIQAVKALVKQDVKQVARVIVKLAVNQSQKQIEDRITLVP